MPDHLHVVDDAVDPQAARESLSRLIASFMRGAGSRNWEPVPSPSLIADVQKLRRDVRYVALNPCREGLCRDPVEWVWSTHRDVIGGVTDPWVTPERLARALKEPVADFARRHHAYVSSDPSVRVDGSRLVAPVVPSEFPVNGLDRIARAAAASLRIPVSQLRESRAARRLFIQLAQHQGWTNLALLGRYIGMSRSGAGLLARSPAGSVNAARICLADPRLGPPA